MNGRPMYDWEDTVEVSLPNPAGRVQPVVLCPHLLGRRSVACAPRTLATGLLHKPRLS